MSGAAGLSTRDEWFPRWHEEAAPLPPVAASSTH
jgi:hypothetical protein